MFSIRQYRQPTDRLPDLLPWAAIVDEGVVLQKDGLLQQTIAFRGPDLASSTPSELVSAIARLNNALRRFDSGWSVFVEAQRLASTEYPHSSWPDVASWIVDLERRAAFQQAGARFESTYYLTFVWNPPSANARRAEDLFFERSPSRYPERPDSRRDCPVQKAGGGARRHHGRGIPGGPAVERRPDPHVPAFDCVHKPARGPAPRNPHVSRRRPARHGVHARRCPDARRPLHPDLHTVVISSLRLPGNPRRPQSARPRI